MPTPKSLSACTFLAFGVALMTSPAWAGFQWVSPDNTSNNQASVEVSPLSAAAQPVMPAATRPAASSMPEIISPVIISGTAPETYPAPVLSPPAAPMAMPQRMPAEQPVPTVAESIPLSVAPEIAPQAPAHTPEQPHTLAAATLTIPAADGIVQGFGTQIPLPLALRQILPLGYVFSIDQDVDMKTSVSYQGGKGWRETLTDMLAKVGLAAREQGASLSIVRLNAPMMAADPVIKAVPASVPAAHPAMVAELTPLTHPMAEPAPVFARGSELQPTPILSAAEAWSAQRGDSLRKVLTDWCRRGNVELQWVAEYDYPLEASASFNGDFEDAVRSLLAGFENARPQPIAELHNNPNATQKVLVVQARGNSYSN